MENKEVDCKLLRQEKNGYREEFKISILDCILQTR